MVSGDLQEYRSSTGLPGSRSCTEIHVCTNSTGGRSAVVVQVTGVVQMYRSSTCVQWEQNKYRGTGVQV